jgi:glutamate/tyrosine decarboxylase-like PLP-dependent enzyme
MALPVFAFKLASDQAGYSVFDLPERLRTRGWLVPAYTFPREPDRYRGDADRGPQRIQP